MGYLYFCLGTHWCGTMRNHNIDTLKVEEYEEHVDGSVRGEMALWRAVISRAIYDSINNPSAPDKRMQYSLSKAWILGNSEGFLMVCSLADLNPKIINSSAKSIGLVRLLVEFPSISCIMNRQGSAISFT